MTKLTSKQQEFVNASVEVLGNQTILNRADINRVVTEKNISYPHWLVTKTEYRHSRGEYVIPLTNTASSAAIQPVAESTIDMAQIVHLRQPKLIDESDSSVPAIYPDYVPFGFYKDLKNIIKSKQYYPVFITGMSGNGKTLMVEQVCGELHRECIRVNISIETDESDLLGGPTLVNGNVVNRDGPVLTAMKRGAVLLIDEVDRGSNKLMCLQGILEGKPYFNKKSGEMVYPANGFNVIATANTKGRGSEEGRYLAQILDAAFLNRFVITVEQEFPDIKTERKILTSMLEEKHFVDDLCKWADIIRQSFTQGATDELISTRELVHIAKTYNIFKDKMKSIGLVVAKYDDETKHAFLDLYTKVTSDPEIHNDEEVLPIVNGAVGSDDIPF